MGRTSVTYRSGKRTARIRSVGVTSALDAPLESVSQAAFVSWLKTVPVPGMPNRKLWVFAYAVPNGATLAGSAKQRARLMNAMKAQGLKPGVSDICIALPVGRWHGAYIEMKRDRKSKVTDEQKEWLTLMASVGYYTGIAPGLDSAIEHTKTYLKG